jgi:hypothetical protein
VVRMRVEEGGEEVSAEEWRRVEESGERTIKYKV